MTETTTQHITRSKTALLRDALDVLERIRGIVPELRNRITTERLRIEDDRLLRASADYAVQRKGVGRTQRILSSGGGGVPLLRLRAGLPYAVDRFAEYRMAVRRLSSWEHVGNRAAHEVVALAMVFPRSEMIERPKRWYASQRSALAMLIVWDTPLPVLLAVARQVSRIASLDHGPTPSPVRCLAASAAAIDAGRYDVADAWGRRALRLSTERQRWDLAAAAMIRLGRAAWNRGANAMACDWYEGALGLADAEGDAEKGALAAHSLMGLAVRRGDTASVHKFARIALQRYPIGHPRLLGLGNDVAAHWNCVGQYADALRLARELMARPIGDPFIAAAVQANAAIAAAHLGDTTSFEISTARALALAERIPGGHGTSQILVEMADACRVAGQHTRATTIARRALRIARTRAEAEYVVEAERALERATAAAAEPEAKIPVANGGDGDLVQYVAAALAAI